MIGRTVSHYRITAKLGEGGMGEVFLALDTELQRKVALKVLPEALAEDPDRLARFRREAKAVAQLNHPSIVTIHSIEKAVPEGGDRPITFLTMEWIEGKLLSRLIPSRGFKLERFFELALPLADAVSSAHTAGVTHRDLKPDNIMVGADGRLKILDFGLAKMIEPPSASPADSALDTATYTEAGKVMGTVSYMSPEQAEGRPLDHRSDIFSLGVILSEMATGTRPFRGSSEAQVISAILRDTPPPVTEVRHDLPHQLARIIKHCVAKEPSERFQTARDLHTELRDLDEELHAERTPTAPLPPAGRRLVDPASGRPIRWIAGAASLVLLTALAYTFLSGPRQPAPPPPTAGTGTRVAVLPLEDLTRVEGRGSYLAAGITRFLVNQLSELPEINVLSHSHVAAYDDTPQGLSRLVRDSALDLYVEGHVEGAEDAFDVYLNLIDAHDGSVAKGMRFAGTADALFDLHAEVITAIGQELSFVVPATSLARLDRPPTPSQRALLLFLEGLALASRGSDPGDMARAESLLRRSILEDPEFAYAHWGLSQTLLEAFRRAGGGPESLREAQAAAEQALQLDREFDRARLTLAEVHREAGRLPQAIEILEQLTQEGRSHPSLLEVLAISYDEIGDLARSAESLEKVIARRPEGEAYRGLAHAYDQAGDSERALEFLQRALAEDEDLWLNYNALGVHYLERHRFGLAEASLKRARDLAPEETLPLKNLGRLALTRFDLDKAIALYEQLAADQLDADSASNLGTAYFYIGTADSLAKAEEYYSLAVRLRPGNFQLQANLGDLYVRQGRDAEARVQYAKALSLVEEQLEMLPRRELLRIKQPVYLAKLDRCDEAVDHARRLDPELARTYSNLRSLAQAFALCGSNERAIELLAETIPLGYSFEAMSQEDEFSGLRDDPAFQALASL